MFLKTKTLLKADKFSEVYQVLLKKFGHQHWWPASDEFEVMVGAILTQNTNWKNVKRAIENLKQAKKLNPIALKRISRNQLAGLIKPAGYFNVKADRLKHFIDFFFREYQGDVDRMRAEKDEPLRSKLLSVKGIGPETADSILLYALGKPIFVIDAYTKRIFSRHRTLAYEASYDAWQSLFMKSLPPKASLYNDFHAQIVALGKDFCRASQARCETCPLARFF